MQREFDDVHYDSLQAILYLLHTAVRYRSLQITQPVLVVHIHSASTSISHPSLFPGGAPGPTLSARACKLTLTFLLSNALPFQTSKSAITSSSGLFVNDLSNGPPAAPLGPASSPIPLARTDPRSGAIALTPRRASRAAAPAPRSSSAQSFSEIPCGPSCSGAYRNSKPCASEGPAPGMTNGWNELERMRSGVGVEKHAGGGSSGRCASSEGAHRYSKPPVGEGPALGAADGWDDLDGWDELVGWPDSATNRTDGCEGSVCGVLPAGARLL